MKKLGICVLTAVTLLLVCACGGGEGKPPAAQETTSAQETAGATENAAEQTVSYKHRDFEDKYYHFRLKTPRFNGEEYKGVSYYVERLGDEQDDKAVFLITHFNEHQESELYDASALDTAASALNELHKGKVDWFMMAMYGITLKDAQIETEARTIAGLDAVRFSGSYLFDNYGSDWKLGAVGYCIRGKYTPVLLVAIDMSAAQDHLPELSAMIDEMAGTYIDGTGPD